MNPLFAITSKYIDADSQTVSCLESSLKFYDQPSMSEAIHAGYRNDSSNCLVRQGFNSGSTPSDMAPITAGHRINIDNIQACKVLQVSHRYTLPVQE